MFLSFPKTYAAAFSGFYLALMIVLWLLILRGIAIAFRSQQDNPLWREFWDTTFSLASACWRWCWEHPLATWYGVCPWAKQDFSPFRSSPTSGTEKQPGIFDWYTLLVGLLALCTLAGHGGFYLAWKTTGLVGDRSRTLRS